MSRNYANMTVDEILESTIGRNKSQNRTLEELNLLRNEVSDLIAENVRLKGQIANSEKDMAIRLETQAKECMAKCNEFVNQELEKYKVNFENESKKRKHEDEFDIEVERKALEAKRRREEEAMKGEWFECTRPYSKILTGREKIDKMKKACQKKSGSNTDVPSVEDNGKYGKWRTKQPCMSACTTD